MLSDLLDLFYPRVCYLCSGHLSKTEQFVCFGCLFVLPKSHFLSVPDNHMARNLWGRVHIKQAASLYEFKKGNKVQQILHLIKYKNKQDLGIYMGKQMAIAYKSQASCTPSAVVPVPLHKKKEMIRGYNQSQLLAQGFAEILGIPVINNNLIRISSHESQTRKSRYERWINVKEKFDLKNPSEFENKEIVIIDDVFTTGATLEACIQCLNMSNPKSITAYTLASTL